MNQPLTNENTPESPLEGGLSSETIKDIVARGAKLAFIVAFGQIGSVTGASMRTGTARSCHYRWLKEDPTYAADFFEAVEIYADRVRDEITRRALDGAVEVVLFKGQISVDDFGQIVSVRRYSDRLLELLAKAKCPEFKDKIEHSGRLTLEELLGGKD